VWCHIYRVERSEQGREGRGERPMTLLFTVASSVEMPVDARHHPRVRGALCIHAQGRATQPPGLGLDHLKTKYGRLRYAILRYCEALCLNCLGGCSRVRSPSLLETIARNLERQAPTFKAPGILSHKSDEG
jgi:hypothetical protein